MKWQKAPHASSHPWSSMARRAAASDRLETFDVIGIFLQHTLESRASTAMEFQLTKFHGTFAEALPARRTR